MTDSYKGRIHSAWSVSDQVDDVLRPSLDCLGNSSPSSSCSGTLDSCDKSRRFSLRHSNRDLLVQRKAYPLPHPMQFECGISGNSAERDTALGFLQDHDSVAVKKAEEVQEAGSRPKASRKVVVVYDGEKKFTTAPLDIAIQGYATSEGDSIVVLAFLEHILSPMGMKMVADMEQFSGVNDAVLKHGVSSKKMEIESKLRESSRLQLCQMKKIHLDVKVLPGCNSKALVAKEILALQATSAIFDKNAMKNRKYYEGNLSCHVLRLRSYGRRVETVTSLFGREKAGSLTSYCTDSSSGSTEPVCNPPSIWSKLNIFVSKSRTGQFRHSHGSQVSIVTSSEPGSPRPVLQEDEDESTEALEESFSFDTPKPNPTHEALVYAAAGLDHDHSLYTMRRNRGAFSTALVV